MDKVYFFEQNCPQTPSAQDDFKKRRRLIIQYKGTLEDFNDDLLKTNLITIVKGYLADEEQRKVYIGLKDQFRSVVFAHCCSIVSIKPWNYVGKLSNFILENSDKKLAYYQLEKNENVEKEKKWKTKTEHKDFGRRFFDTNREEKVPTNEVFNKSQTLSGFTYDDFCYNIMKGFTVKKIQSLLLTKGDVKSFQEFVRYKTELILTEKTIRDEDPFHFDQEPERLMKISTNIRSSRTLKIHNEEFAEIEEQVTHKKKTKVDNFSGLFNESCSPLIGTINESIFGSGSPTICESTQENIEQCEFYVDPCPEVPATFRDEGKAFQLRNIDKLTELRNEVSLFLKDENKLKEYLVLISCFNVMKITKQLEAGVPLQVLKNAYKNSSNKDEKKLLELIELIEDYLIVYQFKITKEKFCEKSFE